jgi:hypothetical protein
LKGFLQVDAEPPRIVFESPSPCRDADRAEKLLHDALSNSRAPGAGWVVTMRVERDPQKHLKATAQIDDGDGVSVADRSLDGEGAECAGLARAVGVWAGLVLDSRLQAAAALEQPAPTPPTSPVSATTASPPSTAVAPSTTPAAGWPAPAQPEQKTPEHDWYLHHDAGQGRALEFGAGTFIMTGTGGGALAGPTIFAVIEAGGGLFLRPSLAFGGSLTSLPPSDVRSSMWGAARMDACLRLPGLYTRHRGMQLDLCGGTDVGVSSIDSGIGTTTTLPYWDVGPSVDLRGELASNFSAVLRLVAGIEVLREQFIDQYNNNVTVPLVGGRVELALSWDAR